MNSSEACRSACKISNLESSLVSAEGCSNAISKCHIVLFQFQPNQTRVHVVHQQNLRGSMILRCMYELVYMTSCGTYACLSVRHVFQLWQQGRNHLDAWPTLSSAQLSASQQDTLHVPAQCKCRLAARLQLMHWELCPQSSFRKMYSSAIHQKDCTHLAISGQKQDSSSFCGSAKRFIFLQT